MKREACIPDQREQSCKSWSLMGWVWEMWVLRTGAWLVRRGCGVAIVPILSQDSTTSLSLSKPLCSEVPIGLPSRMSGFFLEPPAQSLPLICSSWTSALWLSFCSRLMFVLLGVLCPPGQPYTFKCFSPSTPAFPEGLLTADGLVTSASSLRPCK